MLAVDHIADSGSAHLSVLIWTPQSLPDRCARMEPWRLEEHRSCVWHAQLLDPFAASQRCNLAVVVAECCGPAVLARNPAVLLETLNVDHLELRLDQEVADVEADRFDRTHPDQMQLEGNHLGSLEMKRQKRVPLAEA